MILPNVGLGLRHNRRGGAPAAADAKKNLTIAVNAVTSHFTFHILMGDCFGLFATRCPVTGTRIVHPSGQNRISCRH